MQKEIFKLQEQNASYTEEFLKSSSASNLALARSSTGKSFLMRHEENWRRSLEEEITIIKSNNANLMMRINNITVVTGMDLNAGSAVGRPGSSASLAGLKTQFRMIQ